MTKKQKFIGEYLDKRMKGHGLPMGVAYYSLLGKTILRAEYVWKQLKLSKPITKLK